MNSPRPRQPIYIMLAPPIFFLTDQSKGGVKFGDVLTIQGKKAMIWHRVAGRVFLAEWINTQTADYLNGCTRVVSKDKNQLTLKQKTTVG